MWKMLVGFVVFAGIVVFVLSKTDADIDMGGEKHGIDAGHTEQAASGASEAAPAASPAAPAASTEAPASAASN